MTPLAREIAKAANILQDNPNRIQSHLVNRLESMASRISVAATESVSVELYPRTAIFSQALLFS